LAAEYSGKRTRSAEAVVGGAVQAAGRCSIACGSPPCACAVVELPARWGARAGIRPTPHGVCRRGYVESVAGPSPWRGMN
jgi:hypothetical protein